MAPSLNLGGPRGPEGSNPSPSSTPWFSSSEEKSANLLSWMSWVQAPPEPPIGTKIRVLILFPTNGV